MTASPLFIFGGVSNLVGEPARPGDEVLIAVVALQRTSGLSGLCWMLSQALPAPASIGGPLMDYVGLANVEMGLVRQLLDQLTTATGG